MPIVLPEPGSATMTCQLFWIPNGQGLPRIRFLRVRGGFGELEALSGSRSQALQCFHHRRGMDLLALSIELSSFFSLAESLSPLLFGGFDVLLNLCSNRRHFSPGGFRLDRICFAPGFRLPFT